MVTDSSVRTRRPQEVIVKGLAVIPKTFKSMPTLEKSKELMAKTVVPSNGSNDMPMHYPNLNRHNLAPRKSELTTDIIFQPEPRYEFEKIKSSIKNESEKQNRNKASSENWIPELTRMRSVHRHIAVAKETVNDMIIREINNAREMKQFKVTDFEKALQLESLGAKKKIPCACCYQLFSFVNLPLKVSNKAVVDMHKKWSGNATSGWWVKIDEKLSNLSRCYDDCSVCLFCSQFFHDQDSYRPSFDKLYYEQRKQAYFQQKRLEKEYWDPLKISEKYRLENDLTGKANSDGIDLSSSTASTSLLLESSNSEYDNDSVGSSKVETFKQRTSSISNM